MQMWQTPRRRLHWLMASLNVRLWTRTLLQLLRQHVWMHTALQWRRCDALSFECAATADATNGERGRRGCWRCGRPLQPAPPMPLPASPLLQQH